MIVNCSMTPVEKKRAADADAKASALASGRAVVG